MNCLVVNKAKSIFKGEKNGKKDTIKIYATYEAHT